MSDVPARRASDQVWWRRWWLATRTAAARLYAGRENRYRDVWLVVISALILWTAVTASGAAHDAKSAAHEAKAAGLTAKAAAIKANANVRAIQKSRVQVTRENCLSQNERHNKTIARLGALVEAIKDPAEKARAHANIGGTISLIKALVPKRDCAKVVAWTVRIPSQP